MNKEELASTIGTTTYPRGPFGLLPDGLAALALNSRLVVAYGASDDLIEFEGAIRDEVSAYEGGDAFVDSTGRIPGHDESHDLEGAALSGWAARLEGGQKITAVWGKKDSPAWTFETTIPHATFDIMEDGEVWCRAIVFSLDELVEGAEAPAPTFEYGDELSFNGQAHMIIGTDAEGRYIVTPVDSLLAVTVDGDQLSVSPVTPIRPGEAG